MLPPKSEHVPRIAQRTAQWADHLTDTAIAYAPGEGFAQPVCSATRYGAGLLSEFYGLYVLDIGQGTGVAQRLFQDRAARRPFTALVISENTRAVRFTSQRGATAETRTTVMENDEYQRKRL
jgi:GNAT superfamily N-acetyltransferase